MPAVTLITAVPAFSSPEEHNAIISSTPASFSSIPPVVRHQEPNVTVKLDPAVEGFTDEDAAQGTLYVLTSLLVFMSTTGRGFQIEYPSITLHAISRGENGPSIYCQLDESDPSVPAAENDDEDTELRELTILPQQNGGAARTSRDKNSRRRNVYKELFDIVDPIFEALSMCAALHPDKYAEDDDLDGDDDAFIDVSSFDTFTGDEAQELSEVGRAALAHLESIIYDPHEMNGVDDDGSEEEEKEVLAEDGHPATTTTTPGDA
ncbi:hypothetical protein DXG03_002172 [Asterophora parasitica]|uniref:Methylosome subunit pICln n=1 Tax=Asterophora parasitica TaxID=117018 RepID=A0A9P7GG97_9AGAR|nr:hypothetical protein DXG03_002172 [Asterophora parasitica]